jgi:glutaredoxin
MVVRSLLLWSAAAALAVAASTVPALAQRKNDPSLCPYCKNDPTLMQQSGIVSHGGFQFGKNDTKKVDELLATSDIRWIETAHFEIGFAMGSHKVKQEEKEKLRSELARLAVTLPAVDSREKILDPWLRSHLYAQRAEDVWKRFLGLMRVEESDFPKGDKLYDGKSKYMGIGPYLGEKGKYEVLVVPSEAALVSYLQTHFGLLTKKTQRWNLVDKDVLSVTINGNEDNLREDEALHAHLVFNLTINLLDGYKHYSYDTPIWIREGLAHFCEREISQKFNSFDSSEGAVADVSRKEKWEPEVRKLIASGKAPRMAELVAMKDYSELTLPKHYATWSMVDFLVKTDPAGFACLNDAIHGLLNSEGIPDGSKLLDVHRDKFKECLKFTYAEFDTRWAEWVNANYGSQ